MLTASWRKMYLTMPPITSLACSIGVHHYELQAKDGVGVTFGDLVSMAAEHDPEWWKGTAPHCLEWSQVPFYSPRRRVTIDVKIKDRALWRYTEYQQSKEWAFIRKAL
jgi:hypothetical protein